MNENYEKKTIGRPKIYEEKKVTFSMTILPSLKKKLFSIARKDEISASQWIAREVERVDL